MTDELIARAEEGKYGDLFRIDLFWGAPNHPPIEVELGDDSKLTATNVSSYQGVRVWEVPALPGSAVEAKIDQAIAKTSTNRLVIFHDGDRQVWRWPSRSTKGAGVISRPARHLHTAGSNDPKFIAKLDAIRLPTDVRIDVNELLSRVRGAFDVETKHETRRASKLMAQMYAAVEKGYAPDADPNKRDHEISVTLARVLFLLFGDDTEMWKDPSGEPVPDLFQDFVKDHTARDGSDIAKRLNTLFETLNMTPADRDGLSGELEAFPYVNGGVFGEGITLPDLDVDFRKAILDASAVDWSTISPAIFGSMFQSVRDAQTRRELGEHYTSEENILKTLNPLFLDDLRIEFNAALERATPQKRVNALNALWKRLGELRFMDPACGCGNFIIVAYRELRELELRIMEELANNQLGQDASTLDADWTHLLKVTLDHFYGIEIDEWPARLAETAMFLIDRQSDLKLKERFGTAPERLPIQTQAAITVGNALRLDWSEAGPSAGRIFIAGNPPFLGQKEKSAAQQEDLRIVWGDEYDGYLDYVTGWFGKASQYLADRDGEWAFVSTNSIVQGQPVAPLFQPVFSRGWRIKFAHRTFEWTSDAAGKAAVHCVITGFTRHELARPRLFEYPTIKSAPVEVGVKRINPYLVDGPNVMIRKRMQPLSAQLPPVDSGSTAFDWGYLTIEDGEQLQSVEADPIAKKFVRRFVGGDELINGIDRWCLWLVNATPSDLSNSPELRRRVSEVRKLRSASGRAGTLKAAATPHLFGERRQPAGAYLGIPQTFSENRSHATAARLGPDVIANKKLFTASDPDGFLFALVSSAVFMTWQRTVGGRLKSDPSFSNTIVWNNFPLPQLDAATRSAVIAGGQLVAGVRDRYPDRSLAWLYNPTSMPIELSEAHRALDAVVDAVFGVGKGIDTEEKRQEVLFEEYSRMETGSLGASRKKGGVRQ